jgi:hypothetical protein
VLALGLGGWFAFGRGGDDAGGEPVAGGGGTTTTPTTPPKPKPKPAAPVIDAIAGADGKVALKQRFTLEAKVTAPGSKPMFAWSMPDELFARNRNADKVDVQVMDGLPGVVFDVELEVNDGKGQVDKRTVPITVADYLDDKPLVGFEAKANWIVDKRDNAWVDARNVDDFVACMANKDLRTLTTALDPAETYWEWSGKLTSGVVVLDGSPAKIGRCLSTGMSSSPWIFAVTPSIVALDPTTSVPVIVSPICVSAKMCMPPGATCTWLVL